MNVGFISSGKLRATRVGNRFEIDESDLDQFIEAPEIATTAHERSVS